MDIKNKITAVMEDTHRSIIGEDGLTVWDFAELRDSLTELFTLQEDSFRRKVEELEPDKIEGWDTHCQNGFDHAIDKVISFLKKV